MDLRQKALQSWLGQSFGAEGFALKPVAGDASFRRYFRVSAHGETFIAMDAPPEKENCVPYVHIAQALRKIGVITPEIIKSDLNQGFLLLTDFGDQQLLTALHAENSMQRYGSALEALALLQGCRQVQGWSIPPFTQAFMVQELQLFKHWFLQTYLQLELTPVIEQMLEKCFDFLAASAASQPQVFMHRDYHAANLMVLPDQQIGVLDFQDAFMGPVTYDLVSLLRDCYIDWPEPLVVALALQYKHQLNLAVSDAEFLQWFDCMGMQRHMKALLTFSRKYERDGNPHYLKHIPRTLHYVVAVSQRYKASSALNEFLVQVVSPRFERVSQQCEQ